MVLAQQRSMAKGMGGFACGGLLRLLPINTVSWTFFIGHARGLPASLFINILSWECWVCMKINKFCRSLDQGISLSWDNVLGVTSFLVLPSPSAHLRRQCLWCSWVVIACWTWNWECRPIAVLNANVHGIRSSRKIIRISLSVKVRLRVILMMRKF